VIVGYTTGVFDLFHIGHVNILRNAKSVCDYLIVGCTADNLVFERKNKYPIIPIEERIQILRAIKYVDEVVIQDKMDKMDAYNKYKFNVMIVGDDWQNTPAWNKIEQDFARIGVSVLYFPYTKGTSSTKINSIIDRFN
jgi:glycerol-3-phosphate cytidylyltransferase